VTNEALILTVFRQPACVVYFQLREWDLLIRQARHANVLASLHALLDEHTLLSSVPSQPREHLLWAWLAAERHTQAVRWEVHLIREALAELGMPVILLKGAAYVMAKLPPARGRVFSDIDILVPKNRLNAVEAALMLHGWAGIHLDGYDQRYYRTWMHELPPMQHVKRMTTIDVHHAIVPETASIHPDPARLCADACPVDQMPDTSVLSPVDLVLHSAVHLFHDGEFDNGLRDLIDIQRLLMHFGGAPFFWVSLVERARELELSRPLFYALRYVGLLLGVPIPVEAANGAMLDKPNRLLLVVMDGLFMRALVPDHASCVKRFAGAAKYALYVRANWLRMPPLLLARHLFHKAFISPRSE
jgi:hypothetical protein